MKVGDLVIPSDNNPIFGDPPGVVLEVDINMWSEEVIPSGVSVLWAGGEIETLYEDEIEKLRNIAVE